MTSMYWLCDLSIFITIYIIIKRLSRHWYQSTMAIDMVEAHTSPQGCRITGGLRRGFDMKYPVRTIQITRSVIPTEQDVGVFT